MPASHLTVLVAAAAAGNTVLAVAPRRGSSTDGLCFISPASSCAPTKTARRTRPATAGLSSIAGRASTSTDGQKPALSGHGVTGVSAWWFRRPRAQLRAEAREDGAAGAGADAGAEEGGDDVEEQEREKDFADLDRRQKKFTIAMKELGYSSRWKAVPVLIAEAGRVGLPLNVICLNAAMSVLARSGRWYEALDLLAKMRRGEALRSVGLAVSDQETNPRGNPLGERDGETKRVLFLPEPDTITFNAAISACGRGKKWKPAVDLLDTMRREGLTPDGFSYSTAISACKNCGQWEMALEILEDMKRRGLGRDKHSLNAAIAACASAGRWEPAMEILKGMEANGPDPDVFTYGSAIDALAQGGKLDLALQTLRRMRSDPSRYPAPNTVCYNAALMALMRRGRWREARGLLTEVAATAKAWGSDDGEEGGGGGGGPPQEAEVLDFLSYNSVIRACAAAGEAKEALKTRDEMRAAGIAADAYTYEALAAACGMAGEWEAAEAVLREMMAGCAECAAGAGAGARAVTPPTATPAAPAAAGDTKGGDNAAAGGGSLVAETAAVEAEAVEAAATATATASNTYVGDAATAWNGDSAAAPPAPSPTAGHSYSSPSSASTATVGESWNQKLRHELRQRRRQEQLKNGVPPSPRMFHGLMEAYAQAGEWERALECLDDMLHGLKGALEGEQTAGAGQERVGVRAGVKPDSTSVGWAIQACATAGQWERALALLSGARSEGIPPGQLSYDAALLACAVAGQGKRATSLLEEMASLEARPVGQGAEAEGGNRSGFSSQQQQQQQQQQQPPQRTAGTGPAGVTKRGGDGETFAPWGGTVGPAAGGAFPPPSDSPVPRRSAESFRLVVEACRRAGDTRGALSAFAVMREEGFEPDLACFNEALRACAEGGGRLERAASFLEEVREAALEPNGVSYSAVLKACESCPNQKGAAKTAYDVIQTMIASSNAAPAAAAAAAAAGGGTSVNADDDTTTRAGGRGKSGLPTPSPPDGRDFLAAVRACAGGRSLPGSSSLALRLLTDLKVSAVASAAAAAAAGPSPPPVGIVRLLPEHYHAAMAACGRDGNSGGVLALLSELRRGGPEGGGAAGEEAAVGLRTAALGSRKPDAGSEGEDVGASGSESMKEEEEEEARRTVEATRVATASGLVPALSSSATYAAAAAALADMGEWEWCLVLLEELEQHGAEHDDDDDDDDDTNNTNAEAGLRLSPPETAPATAATTTTTTTTTSEEEEGGGEEAETVLQVELDETSTPVATTYPNGDGEATEASAETLAAYTATVRACGEGRAGVKAVVGVLDRMGWAGVAPGQGTYAAAISAFQACGGVWEGIQEGEGEGGREREAKGGVSVEGAAWALIDYEKDRLGTGWASPFLYSAAIKACAEAGDIANGRQLFAEGRRAAGIATDNARDVAAAAVAAAAAAAEAGTAPAASARVNPGVEAVYMATLTLCAAAGDGNLARDVLRWMKMEGFQTTQEAYVLAIEACCAPAVREDSSYPAAPAAMPLPPPLRPSSSIPPAPRPSTGGTSAEGTVGFRRTLFSQEERGRDRAVGGASQEPAAAAAAAAATLPRNPLPDNGGDASNAQGDGGSGKGVEVEVVGGARVGARRGFSVGDADVVVEEGRSRTSDVKQAAAGRLIIQPPPPSEKETEAEQFGWVAIPGGRETPPEFDEDGEEVADAAVAMGGARPMDDVSKRYEGAGAATGDSGGGGGGGGGAAAAAAVLVAETPGTAGVVAASTGARLEGDGGMPVSPPVASRAGAVSVLSPVPATTAARQAGVSSGERGMPLVASAAPSAGSASAITSPEPSAGDSGSGGTAEAGGIEWQRAKAILDDMVAADHLPAPPAAAFQAVLGACDAAGRGGEALEVASAMVEAGHSPSRRLVARLMASHADVLDREMREMEAAAAAPAEDWGNDA